jgi:hypothetical protein
MRTGQKFPKLFGDPNRPDQQVHRTLKKGRVIALDTVAQKQENPSSNEADCAPFPTKKNEQNQTGENQRNSDPVEQLIPPGTVFVVILSHIAL